MTEDQDLIERLLNPEEGEADISAKALIGAIVTFVVVVIIASIATWFLVKSWSETGPATALPPPSRPTPATGPALQISPPKDLAALRVKEERLLHATEWIDRGAGIARIPIEEAMGLLVKRAGPPMEDSQ